MKKVLFIIFLSSCAISLLAQERQDTIGPWYTDGDISINFSQAYFNNWAAGGENSLSGTGFLNYYANYREGKNKWDNTLNSAYGIMKSGDQDLMKTDDKLELYSDYGYDAWGDWYYSTSFSLKTQFADGYDYKTDSTNPVSTFMAPGYISLGLGMEYSKSKIFKIIISPITVRNTYVLDNTLADAGAFGVDAAQYETRISGNDTTIVKTKDGENVKVAFGCKVRTVLDYEIWTNVNLKTSLELFSDYLDNPQNIDVDWQATLELKINDYLTTTISTQLLYDDDIRFPKTETINGKEVTVGTSPKLQVKEVLSVGLVLKF